MAIVEEVLFLALQTCRRHGGRRFFCRARPTSIVMRLTCKNNHNTVFRIQQDGGVPFKSKYLNAGAFSLKHTFHSMA